MGGFLLGGRMITSHSSASTKSKHKSHNKRKTSNQRGYNYQWQKARLIHLADSPLCRHCLERELVVEATVVDHIQPHKGDRLLFWSRENWQSLCAPCHSRKTVLEDGGFGY